MRAAIATLATSLVQAGKNRAVYARYMEKHLDQQLSYLKPTTPLKITLDGA